MFLTKIPAKYKGILLVLSEAFCFACMNACIRLAGDVPTFQKTLFRNLVAMLVAAVILVREGKGFRPADRSNLPWLLARSAAGTVGMLANFYAVDHLLMPDASMLNKMAPFAAVVFSALLLGEKIRPVQALTLVGAFGGALLIIKPTLGNMVFVPSLVGFCGGICAGLAYTMVRSLGRRGERSSFTVFFFSAFSCLAVMPVVISVWQPLTAGQTLALLGTGLFAAGGQFSVTAAYRYAPAREISVFDYSQVIFSAVLGLLLFSELPDALSFLGYVIICAMAALNFWYSNHGGGARRPHGGGG